MSQDNRNGRRQGELALYEVWLKHMDKPVVVNSSVNAKGHYWEAKKSRYPTFEVPDDGDTGNIYAFSTDDVYMVVAIGDNDPAYQDSTDNRGNRANHG